MPTYEYECKECGHRFEIFQKMTDPKLEACPKCEGRVERLIGPGAGIVFKGSGFYQTDYRSDAYKEKAKAERSGAGSESAKTGDGKGDAASGKTASGESAGKGKAAPPDRDTTKKKGSKSGERPPRPGGPAPRSPTDTGS